VTDLLNHLCFKSDFAIKKVGTPWHLDNDSSFKLQFLVIFIILFDCADGCEGSIHNLFGVRAHESRLTPITPAFSKSISYEPHLNTVHPDFAL